MTTNVLIEHNEYQLILYLDMPATLFELHFVKIHHRSLTRKMFHPIEKMDIKKS